MIETNRGRRRATVTSSLSAILAASFLVFAGCSEADESFDYQTHTVRKGDVRISVKQKGTVQARDPLKVLCPLEGKSTILDIVPEGTLVKKGDWLFDLDVADQQDRLLQQEISTSAAEQALLNAEQQLKIQRNQNESDVNAAILNVQFAELDIRQYREGELPKDRRALEAQITLRLEEEKRAEDVYNWSQKLSEKGFISSDKLESDRLAVKRAEIQLEQAKEELTLLNKYTSVKREQELDSNLKEARLELDRVKAKAAAAETQRLADVKTRRGQHEVEIKQLDRLKFMVENNTVHSEGSGLVVYGRESRGRDSKPLDVGSQVRKDQTIIELPDMSKVLIDVDVHESWVQKIDIGLPVIITTDTGATIDGSIERIASIPDSQRWWQNPDLKVYSTRVTVDNSDRRLKPGMNCSAEIVVVDLGDVLSIPVQAVRDNGDATYCYVKKDVPELRKIKCGQHNGRLVEIVDGLVEGEEVYLAIPPDAEPVPIRKSGTERPVVAKASTKASTTPKEGRSRGKRRGRGEDRGSKRGGGRNPEAMKKAMERYRNASPEEKKKMEAEFGKRGGGGQGGRVGGGG